MRSRSQQVLSLSLPLLALLALPFLPSSSAPTQSATGKYIGASKCKNCHSSEESGNSFGVWSEARHAHAFETLKSDAAKKVAADLGVGDPAQADACLKCHVTGHGQPEDRFARGFKVEMGVQCETCHGPSQDHMKSRFKAAASGAKADGYQALPEGEVVTTPGVGVCVACHNPESPSYQPFCYYEARAKIAHFDPRKPRSDQEKADYGKCPCGSPCTHGDGCPEGVCNLKPDELAAKK